MATSKVNLHIFKEVVRNLSCSRESFYQGVPVLRGGSTQDPSLGDLASFRGCLHGHTAGKEGWAAPPGEHPDRIYGQVEPEGCSWLVPESGGGEWVAKRQHPMRSDVSFGAKVGRQHKFLKEPVL